ncbi:MAG: flagellar biosynthetic protein FliR [Acetobacteraceae bacterium]|nr:flagellar biosynthetic protein FliR [Acetobacteraceae bacterium]
MSAEDFAALGLSSTDLVQLCFAFMLVLARTGAAMALLPGIGEAVAPSMVRAGLAFCIALLVLPGVRPSVPPVPDSGMAAGAAVMAEVVTGLWFGWIARVWVQTLAVSAQFIAYLLGISSVLQPDAELGPQSTALARLFDLAAPLIVLTSGLYQMPLRALDSLYRVVPPGSLLPAAAGTQTSVGVVAETFSLALQLASPFVLASIVWHVAIGLTARLVPRMQIYFVSMPGQILGGTLLLAVSVGTMLTAWREAVRVGLAAAFGAG